MTKHTDNLPKVDYNECVYFILDCQTGEVMPGSLPTYELAKEEALRLTRLHAIFHGLERFACWNVQGPPPVDVIQKATALYLTALARAEIDH